MTATTTAASGLLHTLDFLCTNPVVTHSLSALHERADDRNALHEQADDRNALHEQADDRNALHERADDRNALHEQADDRNARLLRVAPHACLPTTTKQSREYFRKQCEHARAVKQPHYCSVRWLVTCITCTGHVYYSDHSAAAA